jgi:hypothetical protein
MSFATFPFPASAIRNAFKGKTVSAWKPRGGGEREEVGEKREGGRGE